jgi:hypothetical protein
MCVPLLNTGESSGHDGYFYVPRLVEFHENIRAGNLLPRWAPDLENGQGQPLFIFTPPMIHYLAELWYLLGAGLAKAFDFAALSIILVSGCSMFLLCRLLFGTSGGLLGAAAYLYGPYMHVDLYVRRALAEFSAIRLLSANFVRIRQIQHTTGQTIPSAWCGCFWGIDSLPQCFGVAIFAFTNVVFLLPSMAAPFLADVLVANRRDDARPRNVLVLLDPVPLEHEVRPY